jgi:predicted enzyme related to lactoylglutathione lyase
MPGKRPPAGTIVHCELYSEDPEKTKRFYTDVFGWTFNEIPNAGYWIVKAPGRPHGGLLKRRASPKPGGFTPPATLNYILVDSVDEAAKKIVKAGGKILVPKYEIPNMGWFSVFEAPGGIVHNVIEVSPTMTWWE